MTQLTTNDKIVFINSPAMKTWLKKKEKGIYDPATQKFYARKIKYTGFGKVEISDRELLTKQS